MGSSILTRMRGFASQHLILKHQLHHLDFRAKLFFDQHFVQFHRFIHHSYPIHSHYPARSIFHSCYLQQAVSLNYWISHSYGARNYLWISKENRRRVAQWNSIFCLEWVSSSASFNLPSPGAYCSVQFWHLAIQNLALSLSIEWGFHLLLPCFSGEIRLPYVRHCFGRSGFHCLSLLKSPFLRGPCFGWVLELSAPRHPIPIASSYVVS